MSRAKAFAFAVLLTATGCAGSRLVPEIVDAPGMRTLPAVGERNVDGDTAWFTLTDGSREKVRFIGVDTPESTTQHEPFGKEAAGYTASILTVGRGVDLEIDLDERDRYGRLLAYVWISPPATGDAAEARAKMLNAMLVEQGYAMVLTIPPNIAYVDLFVALQLEARNAARGLWAVGS
ncbi:MAG: thermonuclease family protein [Actinomycetota bacterium]